LTIHEKQPLIESLPAPAAIRERLGDTLREVELLRGLLRLATAAENYRSSDRAKTTRESGVRRAE
jgi:hypothetical protein